MAKPYNLLKFVFGLFGFSSHWYVWFIAGEQKALEEGGDLYGKTVYVFGSTERKQLSILPFQLALKFNFATTES